MKQTNAYRRGFVPYAAAALLIGLVGGFSTVLGPAFVQDLGIPYSSTTWTALAQAMSTAACAPVLGRLGDVIGRRKTLLMGIFVFALGNILSALARSLLFMLLARFVVGLGTAAMTPCILAYIVAEFPPQKTARGFSLYMLLSSASVILGPALGGAIIAQRGWRAMVRLCAALSVLTLLLCCLLRGEKPAHRRAMRAFDASGAALVPLLFGALLALPSFAQTFGAASVPFFLSLAVALAALALLIPAERRAAAPLLPLSFLRRRAFVCSVLTLFLTQGLMQSRMTNTIVFVNHTHPGQTALSGLAISVMYLGMSLGAVLLGPLADRHRPQAVLTAALALSALGCALGLRFSAETPRALLLASLGLLGFGLGANGTILMKLALSGLSPRMSGAGAGVYGLFRDLAAPFGVAVLVPFFTNRVETLRAAGLASADAAVQSIHALARLELICIAAGICVVWLLPDITKGEDEKHETL